MAARRLAADTDFSLEFIAPGRPLPAQGLMFVGWFTEKAMTAVDENFLRVVDRVGDTHERVVALMKGAVRSPRHVGASPF
ncbi:hypothetical protein BX265_3607 [Streptomyces sp. TLI_235]|nr:hypothetical protein [Streptomyces sp. TLI_235]PBC78820.1 hypothetical protein BX265_3607 [Streptomyces sp. TLI_235]